MVSLNVSLATKGPYMASKAKNMHQKVHFPWVGGERGGENGGRGRKGGSGGRDIAPLSLGNLTAKFSDTSFPYLKTYFTQIGLCYL